MKLHLFATLVLSTVTFFSLPVRAEGDAPPVMSTPPVSQDEKEAMYNTSVAERTLKIMQALALTDAAVSNRVHNAIIAHYHALRARDSAIDAELGASPQGTAEWESQRLAMLSDMSKPLHDRFIATISKDLTPAQLEIVKDKMTYGKVDFTYSAYCSIFPKLTDEEKAKVMELLKQAREVAMDGGSAGEKSVIFQQYKDQINAYLTSRGYDVNKSIQDWSEKQKAAEQAGNANPAPAGK